MNQRIEVKADNDKSADLHLISVISDSDLSTCQVTSVNGHDYNPV